MIKQLFKKKKPKVWELEEGHVVVPAFVDRGVQYYEIKDLFNTFSARGLQAMQVYEEWEMRLKKDDLMEFILAFEKILNSPKELNVMNLVKVVSMLKDRVLFPVATTDLSYKFASVRYFDENESPYKYDPDYAAQKIARWKEAGSEVDDFFIMQRQADMLPLPRQSEEGLRTYLKAVNDIAESQLKSIRALNLQGSTSGDSSSGRSSTSDTASTATS